MIKNGLAVFLVFGLLCCSEPAGVRKEIEPSSQESFGETGTDLVYQTEDSNAPGHLQAGNRLKAVEVIQGAAGVAVNKVDRKPIDTSVAIEADVVPADRYDFSRKNILPNLFDQNSDEDGVTFGGKLISNPKNPDYFDSVEGIEFSIEVKTQ
ncbi:hypothetical protein MO867_22340 [Microbulbifer sp. OS29]|uniref:Uncharacterized protein n=1 Tax=Microbulbifer okhotskensis TaxID=2926617 RepID=A0A9X2ERK2_9GAMM|nr:hypothetical protein [Microbulbifer okhotskensis]MCO1337067.1 hypothetical protein [Microbulbifer okhotskensis]